MATSKDTISLSSLISYSVAAPLIQDLVQDSSIEYFTGILSLPHVDNHLAPDVLAFVSHQIVLAYAGSLEILVRTNEYGLHAHLHKMCQALAECCPANFQEVFGTIQSAEHAADRVRGLQYPY